MTNGLKVDLHIREIIMKIKNWKLITLPICVLMILTVPYIRRYSRYFYYRVNIADGIYRLYDDQNMECGKISISKSKSNNKEYMTCEYTVEDKRESLTLELIETENGHYYYFQKDDSVYLVIKSYGFSMFDVSGERIQNEFHLFCISQNLYNEITEWMKMYNTLFCRYFRPSLERTLSLHFGKSKID